jgi:predicted kinase
MMLTKDGALDWPQIEKADWWQALALCPQDPRYHGEGDVAAHTRLVIKALPKDAPPNLLLAALLHDCGKPATTKFETDGRITSNGHARIGSIIARRLLWECGTDFIEREAICALVRWHMRPGYFLESQDPERVAITIAATARCDDLQVLAEADTKGRIAPNTEDALVRVGLFGALCEELNCKTQPFPFRNNHSRFEYFRTPGRDPRYEAFDDTRGELIVLAGLPGSGKDTYIKEHLAAHTVISLDAIRLEKRIHPSDPQEPVVMIALERLREALRRGDSIVWNATNLRHELRARSINLAAEYRYRTKIIYREAPFARLFQQNKNRDAAVPEAILNKMIDRWEIPTPLEAHEVEYVDA